MHSPFRPCPFASCTHCCNSSLAYPCPFREPDSCHLHFSNSDRNYVKNALDRLVELNLLHFNPQEVQHIKDVIDLRNRVHIRLTNGNELSNADFNRDIYNDAVNLLKTVDEQIYQYAVPLYGCGHTIPISREP